LLKIPNTCSGASVAGGKFPNGKIENILENFRKFSNKFGIFPLFLENFRKYSGNFPEIFRKISIKIFFPEIIATLSGADE
jgi:hypothetical protein